MKEINKATACYTGGGIYIYYGELSNGLFFRTCDDWESIEICNADTSTEEADYCEFYDTHTVETLTENDFVLFWNSMLNWIISNEPNGNYIVLDLKNRIL